MRSRLSLAFVRLDVVRTLRGEPMTDLPAALRALLREVRQEIPHDTYCSEILAWRGGAERDCQCKRQARVDAEIVRRWAASLLAATDNGSGWPVMKKENADAALRVARSTPTTWADNDTDDEHDGPEGGTPQ